MPVIFIITPENKNYVEAPISGGSGRNGRLQMATLDWLSMFLIFGHCNLW
jgi:hypothetical protein